MDQQTEQQVQPEQALPVVPPVADIDPALVSSPVSIPAQPVATVVEAPIEQSLEEQTAPTHAEPLGRPQQPQSNMLEWQASEYIEHEKSLKWFIILGVIVIAIVGVSIFLMKNYMFALLVVVMGVAIGVWAKRPASEMQYRLGEGSIWVNGKQFELSGFREFGLMQDGAVYTIVLLPNKRFVPGINLYFPPEFGEQIVDALGGSLPMVTLQPDWIDKITRKLNF